MFCQGCWGSIYESDPGADQSAMKLVGYCTSWREMRDIHQSVYLLKRSPGFPSCGECQRRRTIQDILSSLMDQLHKWAYPAATRDLDLPEGGGLDWTKRNLIKLCFGWPTRGYWRPLKPSRVTSRGRARGKGKDCRLIPTAKVEVGAGLILEVSPELTPEVGLEVMPEPIVKAAPNNLQNVCPQSPDKPLPRKRVTFNDPEVEKGPEGEEAGCSTELSIMDVEMWLEFQAWQLGTPVWWQELGAIPGIKDLHKFA